MKSEQDFSGVITALITPFKNGDIDWTSLKKLIRSQLDAGIHGFVVNGTTGESPTLTKEEREKLFKFISAEVSGQVPLIMGTGSNSTAKTIEDTKQALELGADAALVVVPYYNRPPQRGLFQHYQKVAESAPLPIILYNVPGRTVAKLEFDTIKELSRLTNIVGIKEASGDVAFGARIVDACGKSFLVTSGDDPTFVELTGVGGRGVISVASHILPRQFVDCYQRAVAGDSSVVEEFDKFKDLVGYMGVEPNPIPVKMAAYQMGLIERPELRLPLVELSEPYAHEMKNKLKNVGLL